MDGEISRVYQESPTDGSQVSSLMSDRTAEGQILYKITSLEKDQGKALIGMMMAWKFSTRSQC